MLYLELDKSIGKQQLKLDNTNENELIKTMPDEWVFYTFTVINSNDNNYQTGMQYYNYNVD